MALRFMSKKNKKKINRSLSNPLVQYVGGGLISLAAVGAAKVLSDRYPKARKFFRKIDVRRTMGPDEGLSEA